MRLLWNEQPYTNFKKPAESQRRYTPNPSAKQNNANTCADKSENCKTLVEYGWCQMRKAYMENLCSEACGFVVTIIIEAQILWDGSAQYDCNHG